MANDRETKSNEMKRERPQDTSAAVRAGGGETMAGGKDADLTAHGEAGSSGTRSTSRTGERRGDDADIGDTDSMRGSTGGLAGSSR